jgi:nucleoside-diphosphate-sugar epimerase
LQGRHAPLFFARFLRLLHGLIESTSRAARNVSHMTGRRAVVTGAAGFVGHALCSALAEKGWSVLALARGASGIPEHAGPSGGRIQRHAVGDLVQVPSASLSDLMVGSEIVYHLAGRAHRVSEVRRGGTEGGYRRDNIVVARQVAQAALAAGVPRLVHLSSVKAIADTSGVPLGPDAEPTPADIYGRSKLAAERCLRTLADDTALAITVVRPPLVYGPGVKGNLASLLGAVARGIPLPLANARAERSMIGIGNLCDLLLRLAVHDAGFRIYHVRDDDDLCAADLVRQCAEAFGRKPRLFPVPAACVRGLGRIARRDWHARLFEPLRIDDSRTRAELGWRPPLSTRQGIGEMVRAWSARG